MLRDKYSVIRNELGRIPMLTDIYRHDPSLVMTMAQKANSYYDFARDTEAMLSRKGHDEGFADAACADRYARRTVAQNGHRSAVGCNPSARACHP